MKTLGYYNGKYDEIENMTIPMIDRVSWFGDGIYDATYSHNHKIFDLDHHLTRFYNSAKILEINIPIPKDELAALLKDLVLKVDDGLLSGIYEKPKKEEAPSNLINISKYIMSAELLQRIVKYCDENDFGPQDQEYLITDPIIDHIKASGKIHVLPIKGQYLDGGSMEGWLHANNVVCGE